MVRVEYRPLDGVLLFDKPLGLSSNAALQKVRRLFRAKKAGHTGTLDPLATGLLPICFGEATKFSNALLNADKTYRARMRLGQTTTTGDAEGDIVARSRVEVDAAQLPGILSRFRGEIRQLPPMHSAIKHQGKPLYEYIRKGETVQRQVRTVTIHDLVLERFAGDELEITVRCSKGTYIRTLAEDIGQALGCGAHLLALRRLAIGRFRLEEAYDWDRLETMEQAEREACLLPPDALLQDLPALELDEGQAKRIVQGQQLMLERAPQSARIRLYRTGEFVGLGRLQGKLLAPERLLSKAVKNMAITPDGT